MLHCCVFKPNMLTSLFPVSVICVTYIYRTRLASSLQRSAVLSSWFSPKTRNVLCLAATEAQKETAAEWACGRQLRSDYVYNILPTYKDTSTKAQSCVLTKARTAHSIGPYSSALHTNEHSVPPTCSEERRQLEP